MTLEVIRTKLPGRVTHEHVYHDTAGEEIMRVFRCETADRKEYRPIKREGDGWVFGQVAKPWPLYRLPLIMQAGKIIVVEGEKVADTLAEYGITATTGPHGAGKAAHCDWTPLAGKKIILWRDHDGPGRKHMDEVIAILERLDPKPALKILDPADLDMQHKEDAHDYIEQLKILGGDVRAGLLKALGEARRRSASSGLLQQIEDTIAGRRECIPWPWSGLTRLCRALMPSAVTLVCGDPGDGKSLLMLQCLVFWLKLGVRASIYELEDDRQYHLERVLAQLDENSDLTDSDWVKANPEKARSAYNRHQAVLDEVGQHITASGCKEISLDELAAWVDTQAKAGYRVIVIDPVTACMQTNEPWKSDKRFLTKVKNTADEYGASIVIVIHPKKNNRSKGPSLSDLAGGAAYQRFAHNILWIEKHKCMKTDEVSTCPGRVEVKYNRTLHICKTRNGPGAGLRLAYTFSGKNLLFSEQGIIVGKQK